MEPISNTSLAQPTALPLAHLSAKDKQWDKHKANSDKIADFYKQGFHPKKSEEVLNCAMMLDFLLVPEQEEYKLKLNSAYFCRNRHCPLCSWRRSMRWKAKAHQVFPKVFQDYPTHRYLFLTLTIKNCPVNQLNETISDIHKGFKRLSQRKAFPGVGWIKSLEVTKAKDNTAHPHLHILLMVKASYFSHGYIKQDKWRELWQDCLKIDYLPVCHITAINKLENLKVIIPELLKYTTKASDLVNNLDWFLEYVDQMKNVRAIAVGGLFKKYFRELEEEPEDLIGKENNLEDAPDEGHLYFNWIRHHKQYQLKD